MLVLLLVVDVAYFSLSGFLITACIDSPSANPKVDSSVSSFNIFPEIMNNVTLVNEFDIGQWRGSVGLGA